MPTYAYACKDCSHAFEIVQSFTDNSLTSCPECEGTLRKKFNSVGVVFKGSGFYRTDSRDAKGSTVSPAPAATPAAPAAARNGRRELTRARRPRSAACPAATRPPSVFPHRPPGACPAVPDGASVASWPQLLPLFGPRRSLRSFRRRLPHGFSAAAVRRASGMAMPAQSYVPHRGSTPRARAGQGAATRPPGGWLIRNRRLAVALLLCIAAGITVQQLTPAPDETVGAVAAARDLPAGKTLDAADLAVLNIPPGLLPGGSFGDSAALQGKQLAVPLREGQLISDSQLLGPGLLAGSPPGSAAVPLRMADPSSVQLVSPGQLINVVMSGDNGFDRRAVRGFGRRRAGAVDLRAGRQGGAVAWGRRDGGPHRRGRRCRSVPAARRRLHPRQAVLRPGPAGTG